MQNGIVMNKTDPKTIKSGFVGIIALVLDLRTERCGHFTCI